jgi:hypothetical protein
MSYGTTKTIDINGKEWRDRLYGNSYFSARVIVNHGMDDEKIIHIPFQYGYGDYYIQKSLETLEKMSLVPLHSSTWTLKDHLGVIVHAHIERNCLRRDVKAWGAI